VADISRGGKASVAADTPEISRARLSRSMEKARLKAADAAEISRG